jgi:hypothetical protein
VTRPQTAWVMRSVWQCQAVTTSAAMPAARIREIGAVRWAANSREYSRGGSHVPSTRDSNRSASVSGRPTAGRSRRCAERIALSIVSSRGGTGRPRALRSVLVGTVGAPASICRMELRVETGRGRARASDGGGFELGVPEAQISR